MALYSEIDQTMPVTINASRIVISDEAAFVDLAVRTGNDAFRRVGTPLGDGHKLSSSEAEALFQILDHPDNQRLFEESGELQCVAMDDDGLDLLSAWISIDQAIELFPVGCPILGPFRTIFFGYKNAGAELLDFDFYKSSVVQRASS